MSKIPDFGALFEEICGMLSTWNDAEEEPDERARGNNLFCLVLAEDGSGVVGTVDYAPTRQGNIGNYFYFKDIMDGPGALNGRTFSNLEELVKILETGG